MINISSGGMYTQPFPAGDWESERSEYSPKKFYARTKREEVAITGLMAERLCERGVAVHAMHPGWADTEGVQALDADVPETHPADHPHRQSRAPTRSCGSARRPRPSLRPDSSGTTAAPARPTTAWLLRPSSEAHRQRLWGYCEASARRAGIAWL